MKYNHLLLISIILPSIVSGMEIKRTVKQKAFNKWVYREKMTITLTDATHNDHDTYITLTDKQTDQTNDNGNDHDESIKLTKNNSWGLQKKKSFDLVH